MGTTDEVNKIVGAIIIFGMMILMAIVNVGIGLVEKLIDMGISKAPMPLATIQQAVSLPNPRQLYFIDCVDGDVGTIITKRGKVYYYTCEKGYWSESKPL